MRILAFMVVVVKANVLTLENVADAYYRLTYRQNMVGLGMR